MKQFMDDDFLLENSTAKTLYHQYAAPMPIVDYHSHVSPREIAEDRRFDNITQLWLESDHYKWRLMRWCGVEEAYITGKATDWEKFNAFAAALPRAVGNPVYHWTHLELKTYFNCDPTLGPDTAEEIWHTCNNRLQNGLSVRGIIRQSNVKALCTTDDPADDLRWHSRLAQDADFGVKVLPTFRPDRALNIHRPGFAEYLDALSTACGKPIGSFTALCEALAARLDFFVKNGCRAADHGLDEIPWNPATADPETVFQRAAGGEAVPFADAEGYQAALLLYLAKRYNEHNIAMQLHYGVQRNVNPPAFAALGADAGCDCMATPDSARKLGALLGEMAAADALPKTILYSLNPTGNEMLASLAGSFQGGGMPGRVQHGSAWWFNDSKRGMEAQLSSLADVGVLGSFVGMLTDSRSFTGYVRHGYFRRILCNLIGKWVENGEYPADLDQLGKLVQDISYNNAARYFGLL